MGEKKIPTGGGGFWIQGGQLQKEAYRWEKVDDIITRRMEILWGTD